MGKAQRNVPNIKLRDQRLQRKWTQADLARALGVTDLTVGRWERGEAIPFLYYQQKLSDLFGATPEELGFNSIPEELDFNSISKEPNLQSPLEEFGFAAGPETNFQQNREEVLNHWPYESTNVLTPVPAVLLETAPPPIRSVDGTPKTFKRRILPARFLWLSVILVLVVIAGSGAILYFNKQKTSTSVSNKAPVSVTQKASNKAPVSVTQKATSSNPGPSILYQADWSHNPDNWPIATNTNIHWAENMLETDLTTQNTIIFAPYSPTVSSYAIEVQMQRISYSDTGGKAYGIAVGTTSSDGYICGVGEHFFPEHFFMAHLNIANTAPLYRLSDIYDADTALDTAWHTYRVEVKPGKMSFFLDNALLQTVNLTPNLQPGRIGIYVDNVALAIKSFNVSTLS